MATYLISLSLLIIAVIIIRAIFRRKTSQRLIYAMWLLVVVRMILPFSLFEIEIPNSLYASITPDTETILQNEIPSPETDEIISSHDSESTNETDVGINAGIDNDTIDSTEDISPTPPAIPETAPVVNTDNKAHKIEAEKALYFIWGAGAAAMSLWFFISWLLFTFKLWNTDVFHSEFNGIKVYISDKIASPCVAGVKPIIYITPEAAESENLSYVLAHEYTHLHHGDRVWSAVRVIATCVFWWNPLVWAAAFLSKSDAELACDESVIKGFNEGDRLAYANSIVDMTPKRSNYAIGFGNGSIKERIVMLTKITPKKLIASVIAIAIAISCIGCAYIEPKQENENIETNAPSDKENNSDVIKLSGKIEMTLEEFNGYLAHWSDIETPGENYTVEITDMSTAVTAEIHNNTIIAKIQAYGNTVNINEEAHYSMLLWEFEDAVIFEKTYYDVGDTYVITEYGIDSLHKGDDFTLSLEKSENCLYYINMCNKYSTAVQEVTAGLNVATSWDDVYYEKGVAYIENGKIVISDADVNVVLAKDAFNFESVFKAEQDNAIANGTKYYKDINDLFEANKTYIVENYEDTTTEVDESETANLDIEIQKKFSGGEVSDKIKYLCEKKIAINDETYYIAKYMYLQGGEWITGETNPMYLVKEDMTKMYDAGITIDGKDLRYSKKVNYFDENDTLMVYLEKEPETTVPETTAPETNPPETTPPETTPPVTNPPETEPPETEPSGPPPTDLSHFYITEDGYIHDSRPSTLQNYEGVLVIPEEVNGVKVTKIRDVSFSYLLKITEIIIPDTVEYIGPQAFVGCPNLKKVTLPKNLKTIDMGSFALCDNLSEIVLPEGLEYIAEFAFSECSNLKSIHIPQSVTTIDGRAFSNNGGDLVVTVEKGNPNYYVKGNCLIDSRTKTITLGSNQSVIPDDGSVTAIGLAAFYGCTGLTTITIPPTIIKLHPEAFKYCTNITSINLPTTITEIPGDCFSRCSSLKNVHIPDSVTIVGNSAFRGCYSLENVSLPDSITYVGSYSFAECTLLKTLYIPPSVDFYSLGRHLVYGCESLTALYIGTTLPFPYEPQYYDASEQFGTSANIFWGYTPPA